MTRFLPPLLLLWSLGVTPAFANEKIRTDSVAEVAADSIAALAHSTHHQKVRRLQQNSNKVRQGDDDKFNLDARLYMVPGQETAR